MKLLVTADDFAITYAAADGCSLIVRLRRMALIDY